MIIRGKIEVQSVKIRSDFIPWRIHCGAEVDRFGPVGPFFVRKVKVPAAKTTFTVTGKEKGVAIGSQTGKACTSFGIVIGKSAFVVPGTVEIDIRQDDAQIQPCTRNLPYSRGEIIFGRSGISSIGRECSWSDAEITDSWTNHNGCLQGTIGRHH